MELHLLKQHLNEAYKSLIIYTDYQTEIENERYRIMFYNKNSRHIYIGLAIGWALYLIAYHFIISSNQVVITGFITFGFGIAVMRWIVGPIFDKQKKESMKEAARKRFEPFVKEMDSIALKLEESAIIPEKYRTLHAVSHLLDYIQNGRIDTLKEGINLYEDEMSKQKQQHSLNIMLHQNEKMIRQNGKIILQQREMIRAQRTTNAILLFK